MASCQAQFIFNMKEFLSDSGTEDDLQSKSILKSQLKKYQFQKYQTITNNTTNYVQSDATEIQLEYQSDATGIYIFQLNLYICCFLHIYKSVLFPKPTDLTRNTAQSYSVRTEKTLK